MSRNPFQSAINEIAETYNLNYELSDGCVEFVFEDSHSGCTITQEMRLRGESLLVCTAVDIPERIDRTSLLWMLNTVNGNLSEGSLSLDPIKGRLVYRLSTGDSERVSFDPESVLDIMYRGLRVVSSLMDGIRNGKTAGIMEGTEGYLSKEVRRSDDMYR